MPKSQCTEVYFKSALATFVSSKKVEDVVGSSLDLEISNFPLNLSVTDESRKLGRSSAHSAQCTVASVHNAQCIVASVHCGLCALCTVHRGHCIAQCTFHCSGFCTLCIQLPLWIRVD